MDGVTPILEASLRKSVVLNGGGLYTSFFSFLYDFTIPSFPFIALKFIEPGYTNIRRAKFSALTSQEVKDAFDNLLDVNYGLADSAKAREEIDLLWGAVLTRFFSVTSNRLWKDFISVGRVQTPTLALIVEREEEITSFVPEKYFVINVTFNKGIDFQGVYEKNIKDEDEANKIFWLCF